MVRDVQPTRFAVTRPAPKRDICECAQELETWCARKFQELGDTASLIKVNQAKLLLQDKWHEWRRLAPKSHRNHLNPDHRCLFTVYSETYDRLRLIEARLDPPLFHPPAPPKPAVARQSPETYIVLGEIKENTDDQAS